MTPAELYTALLGKHGGNAYLALQDACAGLLAVDREVSWGFVRKGNATGSQRRPKPVVPALDIPPVSEGAPGG